jgi:ribosomal protein S18 acetylase RimI-like enzyme
MELVEATEDDVDMLAELWFALATDMEQYSELNRLSYSTGDEVPGASFEEQIEREDVTVLLLREGDATLGYLTLRRGTHPSRVHADYLHIVDLFVDEAYRSHGYGSEAVERVKKMAQERGCDYLKVSCERNNAGARRFYEDCGFEEKRVQYTYRLDRAPES